MTSNPLIDKYNELYGKKEEPIVEEPVVKEFVFPEGWKTSCTIPQPVISSTGITNSHTISNFTSRDYTMGNDNFLQIAELIKNQEARVNSFSTTTSNMLTRTIEFSVEVWM